MGVDWPRRILTVLVGIPTALQLLRYDAGMWCLATALCSLCLVEVATNIAPRIGPLQPSARPRMHAAALVTAGVAICGAAWTAHKTVHDAVQIACIVAVCCCHLVCIDKVDLAALTTALLDVFAIVYVVSGFSHAILLRYVTPFGLGFQILGLSCAWVCDSGALIAGSLLGRAKLAPRVSPGKTIVGAVAGICSSAATVVLFFNLPEWMEGASSPTTSWVHTNLLNELLPSTATVSASEQILLGLGLGVLCILGDLVESLLKRVADVKDSGAFFPGHGGCLDRMDSFLFVAQALYYYCSLRFSG